LCAISVTEPGTGSDVASVALRATRVDGGWRLNGGKTWCTFAGRAEAILVLARTDPDARPPHRGLSLFVVEKPAFDGHAFEYEEPRGGIVSGRAIPTIGYRGMHSFEMFYDDFFVPADALVGEDGGEGRGFYYTMRGFSGGRLQTAARASGLMRAAFEAALRYAEEREVFDRPVASYPLTLQKLARMGMYATVCQQSSYWAARLMDAGGGQTEASLVKLFACKVAEFVTREAMQIHGGLGYAEETDVSRYFVDARVLSIFEGAEETLALKVVGRALLGEARRG
ncbi:MAG: acyl-CoA dehydrogenase, partial [Gammaproteobacteria bacterium]|nr:acyl-CoA dehydrogenase [Gammaproteobacteria bacterium]